MNEKERAEIHRQIEQLVAKPPPEKPIPYTLTELAHALR